MNREMQTRAIGYLYGMSPPSWRKIVDDIFRDLVNPIVLKYSVLSILGASAFIALVGHFVLDFGIHSVLALPVIEKWLPTSVGIGAGFISFVLSFLLFSLAMPLFAAILFPLSSFCQLLLAESFAVEFQQRHFPEVPPNMSSTWTNILILVKWTLVKLALFFVLLPLLHLPLLGIAIHIFLVTLWITLIYFEIVARRYFVKLEYRKVFWKNFHRLCIISLFSVITNYILLWLLGFLGFAFPFTRPILLFIIFSLNITSNYVLMAEFIRYFSCCTRANS